MTTKSNFKIVCACWGIKNFNRNQLFNFVLKISNILIILYSYVEIQSRLVTDFINYFLSSIVFFLLNQNYSNVKIIFENQKS